MPGRVVLFAPGHVYLNNKRIVFVPASRSLSCMNFPLKNVEDECLVNLVFGVKAIRFTCNRQPMPLVVKIILDKDNRAPIYLLLLSFLAQVRFGRGARAFGGQPGVLDRPVATGGRSGSLAPSESPSTSSRSVAEDASLTASASAPSLASASSASASLASSPSSAASTPRRPADVHPPPLDLPSPDPRRPRSRRSLFAAFSRAAAGDGGPTAPRPATAPPAAGDPFQSGGKGVPVTGTPEGRRVAFWDPASQAVHLAVEVPRAWDAARAEEEAEAREPWQRPSRLYSREDFDRMAAEIETIVRRKARRSSGFFGRSRRGGAGSGAGAAEGPSLGLHCFLSLRMETLGELFGMELVPPPLELDELTPATALPPAAARAAPNDTGAAEVTREVPAAAAGSAGAGARGQRPRAPHDRRESASHGHGAGAGHGHGHGHGHGAHTPVPILDPRPGGVLSVVLAP
eukprot:tig00021352_g20696.t1